MRKGRKEDEEITPYTVLEKREWNLFSCQNHTKTKISNQYATLNNTYRK
jgi:hypothetical protein